MVTVALILFYFRCADVHTSETIIFIHQIIENQ